MSDQVYVGNIPWEANETDILSVFGPEAVSVRIPTDTVTGKSRGFGFVRMQSENSAVDALSKHETVLKGRSLIVRAYDAGHRKPVQS